MVAENTAPREVFIVQRRNRVGVQCLAPTGYRRVDVVHDPGVCRRHRNVPGGRGRGQVRELLGQRHRLVDQVDRGVAVDCTVQFGSAIFMPAAMEPGARDPSGPITTSPSGALELWRRVKGFSGLKSARIACPATSVKEGKLRWRGRTHPRR